MLVRKVKRLGDSEAEECFSFKTYSASFVAIPQFRTQRGRLGAYTSWAKTEDHTANARKASMDRFEREPLSA
jgi:hypothetical protein